MIERGINEILLANILITNKLLSLMKRQTGSSKRPKYLYMLKVVERTETQ